MRSRNPFAWLVQYLRYRTAVGNIEYQSVAVYCMTQLTVNLPLDIINQAIADRGVAFCRARAVALKPGVMRCSKSELRLLPQFY
jgi:hypothetical protein